MQFSSSAERFSLTLFSIDGNDTVHLSFSAERFSLGRSAGPYQHHSKEWSESCVFTTARVMTPAPNGGCYIQQATRLNGFFA